jgi:AraC-like DNA-binding protein
VGDGVKGADVEPDWDEAAQPVPDFEADNADDLAAWLNLSARTLHRQLKEEGASLQQLKDAVRRDLAMDLLLRTQRPIKQIAGEVGFQNEKSFMRAFKGWTGVTPEGVRLRNGVVPNDATAIAI